LQRKLEPRSLEVKLKTTRRKRRLVLGSFGGRRNRFARKTHCHGDISLLVRTGLLYLQPCLLAGNIRLNLRRSL